MTGLLFTSKHAALGRYADPLGGDRLDIERRQSVPSYHPPSHGKRYCEGCQTYRKKPTGPAVKGWRCGECKAAAFNPPTENQDGK